MNKIITYSFGDNFIDNLAAYITREYFDRKKDLSRTAVVFGGKRPALFLKRELSQRLGRAFVSPHFFTIDEWMRYIAGKKALFTSGQDLNQCYTLYHLARELTPEILKDRESFARFLPWAREILNFIEQLDLENVDNPKLNRVQENARIGYPVPADINRLLEKIVILREGYHRHMKAIQVFSRGFQYLCAAQNIKQIELEEFEHILFCNFFYLNRCEEAVIKELYQRGRTVLFFQGDERRWPVFQRTSRLLSTSIQEGEDMARPRFNLSLHQAFDVHSQVGIVKELLKRMEHPDRTVIVLPDAAHIIPLLSEAAVVLKEFNVSMGYPLKRSSLYSLLEYIFQAQLSRKAGAYYARDYLKVLRHPLVKNLTLHLEPSVTRILIHKIEEILTGKHMTEISGSLFIRLDKLEVDDDLYYLTQRTLKGMNINIAKAELQAMVRQIHASVLVQWETVADFENFARSLKDFLLMLLEKSHIHKYPLNLKIAARLMSLCDELETAAFKCERFPIEDLFKIFRNKVEREMVSFKGSPLKGLQILGLFETRALNFDNVIVMDVNEGVLPRLNIYEALIPREIMISLNLDRLEQEEEIQRYQFMRLISSAKNVHLVYQQSKDKERSRFVEELVWDAEKEKGRLNAVQAETAGFAVEIVPVRKQVKKTPAISAFLQGYTFSASSVDSYLRNPWDFYMNHVLGLREAEDLLDEPENRQVGTFVHELLEQTFRPFAGKKPRIDEGFKRTFKKCLDEKFSRTFGRSMHSESFLLKAVLDERLTRFLEKEAHSPERQVREILHLEDTFKDVLDLSCGKIKFVFKLDRVDRLEDGSVLILDYKTGSVDPVPKALDKIESMDLSRESIYQNVKSFQLPLYYYYLSRQYLGEEVNAAFYNLRTLELHPFVGKRVQNDPQRITRIFSRALDFVVSEILDPAVPFVDVGE